MMKRNGNFTDLQRGLETGSMHWYIAIVNPQSARICRIPKKKPSPNRKSDECSVLGGNFV